MSRVVLCAVAVLALTASLGLAGRNPDEVKYTLSSGRYYFVSNPKGIPSSGEKSPILLFLHGMNCACQNADETTNLIRALGTHNFKALIVSACGVNAQWDVFGSSSSDLPFLQQVLADVATKYNVDTSKVFAEGFSMGGMMASVAGCALGNKIFSLGFSMNGCGIQCASLKAPVHVLAVDGQQDSVCPYTHQLSSYNSWKTFASQEKCAEQSKLGDSVQTCSGMEVDFYYPQGPHAVIESNSFSGSNKSVEFMIARLGTLPPAPTPSTAPAPPPTPSTGPAPPPAPTTICAAAAEGQQASLSCPAGKTITAISFASYGLPSGSCPSFTAGSCHASSSVAQVQSACLGKSSCSVAASNNVFGDPCSGRGKTLDIAATCA